MSSALLFSNNGQDVFVLDIPRSLELGNGGGRIHAVKAPNQQYKTPEPKGKKRETFISTLPVKHVEYHDLLQKEIQHALQVLHGSHDLTQWCFPRKESSQLEAVSQLDVAAACIGTKRQEPLPIILSTLRNDYPSGESISHQVVLNHNVHPTHICLSSTTHILVPAMCAFLWSDVVYSLGVLQGYSLGSDLKFDMILMDPPWSNRSVRNGYKYSTIENQLSDPFDFALTMVERHGKANGYVAIWITNKNAVHERVVRSLACLNFTLVEEWIWIKVTTKGEPITPLDGVWRRPYETLLLFRHGSQPCTPLRRYIFAVPDTHSRKPNLKELFSKLIQPAIVLEIFARNLTSSWWCIGNEVLKFQLQEAWYCWPRRFGEQVGAESGPSQADKRRSIPE